MKKMMNFSTIYKYFATSKPHIFYTLQTKSGNTYHFVMFFAKPHRNSDKKTKKAAPKRSRFCYQIIGGIIRQSYRT